MHSLAGPMLLHSEHMWHSFMPQRQHGEAYILPAAPHLLQTYLPMMSMPTAGWKRTSPAAQAASSAGAAWPMLKLPVAATAFSACSSRSTRP